MKGILEGIAVIVVETDEEHSETIALITENEANAADGYRIRLTPDHTRRTRNE